MLLKMLKMNQLAEQPTPSYQALAATFCEVIAQWKDQRVAVIGHRRPDGDCVGSQIALTRVLRDRGVDAFCLNQDPVPKNLAPFVGDTPYFQTGEVRLENTHGVMVDCADAARCGAPIASAFPEILLNIDHHISNPEYAVHNIVVSSSSATAEILACLFTEAGILFDSVTAQALFVGIATDTGQFRFNTTTPLTFEICRRLCDFGATPASAAQILYEQESIGSIQLLQKFLASLRLEFDGRVCIGFVEDGLYAVTNTSSEDSEGLVDYTRSIEGVEIGVFLEEQNGQIKGSFRSKEPHFRVNEMAAQLNGGGHACAAGFQVRGEIQSFYPQLLALVASHLEAIAAPVA